MSSGFISEKDIAEVRKKRQEEWERVRKAEDPLERPEETADCRSLFDRLKEQKMKKDLEYDEAHKLKNLVHVLDNDEIEFLELIEKKKANIVNQHEIEEKKELEDFREKVSALQDKTLEIKVQSESKLNKPKVQNVTNRLSQKIVLQGAVTRKRKKSDSEHIDEYKITDIPTKMCTKGALKCIGILPGIGKYRNSSDSEMSSDSDEEIETQKYDLVGRKNCSLEKNNVQVHS